MGIKEVRSGKGRTPVHHEGWSVSFMALSRDFGQSSAPAASVSLEEVFSHAR